MTLQIDFWQLVVLLVGIMTAVLGGVIGLARWLATEYDSRQQMRFAEFKAAAEVANRNHSLELARHMQTGEMELARIAEHAERLARIEEAVRRGPSHEDLKNVYSRLNQIATKTDTMHGQLQWIVDNVRMILNKND